LNLPLLSAVLGLIATATVLIYVFYKPQQKPQTDTLYTDALNAMVKADKVTAINLLRDVVKQDSDHINAYLQLGNILRDENPEQATKIHQSLTVRPNLSIEVQVDIHQALAKDYEQLERLEPAKNEAEQILRLSKKNIWAQKFLLRMAEDTEDWDRASQLARQLQKFTASKNDHELARFDVYKGLQFLKDGKHSEALSYFDKALKTAPDFGLPYKYKGNIYEQSRDLVKAVDNWELYAIKEPQKAFKVFARIEAALFDLGRYSEVENFYRRILDNDPKNFQAIIHLANVLEEKGEGQAALALVEETLKPDNPDVRGALMKLKLSLTTSTPIELAHQVDAILETLSILENG
jgi:lipopolysaccharide biosynthesis regulator YciM